MQSSKGPNVWDTALLIGFDEPGGTYDHVPPGAVPPPDLDEPPQFGFAFDRSGYRVPAVIVSPWVPLGLRLPERFPPPLVEGDATRYREAGRAVHGPRGSRTDLRASLQPRD